ncbi:MAG: hypothetical protein AAF480_07750 [Actinomycetota bacterium]
MATITRSTPSPRLMGIINPLVSFLVGRGRGRVAERLMVLHWTGRKTGEEYSTPVSRFDRDGRLFTNTRASYKHNFTDGWPAEIVLDGERQPFVGTAISAPELVGERMRELLDALGPKHGPRALGLKVEGDPTVDELAAHAAHEGLVVIEFEPA